MFATRSLAAALFASTALASPVRLDVEVDPTAYALQGYSLHAGIAWKRMRVDLGAFAMTLPALVHGQDAFEVGFDGYGIKVQYFLFAEQTGAFVGVDASLTRALVQLVGTELASRRAQLGGGAHAGWRFNLAAGFYVTPWLGLSYIDAEDVTLAGQTFDANPWVVFPAVHFGRRFD